MKNFAITGVAGYIAPRHLNAIRDTGNRLVAAMDPHDSVGRLDQYFPNAAFFTEFERFDRHLEKLRKVNKEDSIDYLSICAPNHLHDAHIRLALRLDADAICEKPLVLNPWNLDALADLEIETGRRVYTVLQLRLHPSLIALHKKIQDELPRRGKRYQVELKYITSRGLWYDFSWKGIKEKSGGIATNIGIHFFDMLIWMFGAVENVRVDLSEKRRMNGELELKNADVKWALSLERSDLPPDWEKPTYRSIKIDGSEIEFTEGFTELHTEVYRNVLADNGFGIDVVRPSIELVEKLRKWQSTG
jgi:UDP-N-acetyl-2-amino-2-deoxyglucuronate dehydrogenase